jgi:ketosteroid isomerase-like protein
VDIDDDVVAIRQVIAAYEHSLDDLDTDTLVGLFTDDAVLELGPFTGTGRTDAARWVELVANAPGRRHYTTNVTVQVDGDGATARSYVQIFNTRPGERPKLRVSGRYVDTFVRADGGQWLIAKRSFLEDEGSREPVGS